MKLASLPTVPKAAFSLDLESFTITAWRGEALVSNPNAFVSIKRQEDPLDELDLLAGSHLYANADFSGDTPLISVIKGSIEMEGAGVSLGFKLKAGDITSPPFHRVGSKSLYSPTHRTLIVIPREPFTGAIGCFAGAQMPEPAHNEPAIAPELIEHADETRGAAEAPLEYIGASHGDRLPTRYFGRVQAYVESGKSICAQLYTRDFRRLGCFNLPEDAEAAKDASLLGFDITSDGLAMWPGDLRSFVDVAKERGFDLSIGGDFRASKISVRIDAASTGYTLRLSGSVSGCDITNVPLIKQHGTAWSGAYITVFDEVTVSFSLPPALKAFLVAIRPHVGRQISGPNHVAIKPSARRIFAIYARSKWSDFEFISPFKAMLPEDCPDVPLSKFFKGSFMEHQWLPYRWMSDLAATNLGGILADDMRMGKSVVSIALMARAKELSEGKSVVICPPDVIDGWVKKLREFAPQLKPLIMVGDIKDKSGVNRHLKNDDYDVLFVSLFSLRAEFAQKALDRRFACAFFDEAHMRKNPKSEAFAVMLGIEADARFALTGTPIENRPLDAWALTHLCLPHALMTADDFKKTFDFPISSGDMMAARDLSQFLAPFVVRRTRSSIDGLYVPPKTTIKETSLLTCQSDAYHGVLENFRGEYSHLLSREDKDGKISFVEHGAVLATIGRLRSLCAYHRSGNRVSSGKFTPLLELVSQIKGESFIVFSSWVEPLYALQRLLDINRISSATMTGLLKRPERSELLEKFRGRQMQGLLATTKLGSVGVDLPEANHIFFLDPWWNPFIESQAAARAEMLNKKTGISVTRLIAEDTIEEKVLRIQDHKRDVFEAIFGSGESIKPKLTVSLIQDLLGED